MRITVDTVNAPASMMSTIITASGLDAQGRRVTFAGDHRPMRDLAEVVEQEGEVTVDLEPWQVLSVVDPAPEPDEADLPVDPAGTAPLFEVVAEVEVDRGL